MFSVTFDNARIKAYIERGFVLPYIYKAMYSKMDQ